MWPRRRIAAPRTDVVVNRCLCQGRSCGKVLAVAVKAIRTVFVDELRLFLVSIDLEISAELFDRCHYLGDLLRVSAVLREEELGEANNSLADLRLIQGIAVGESDGFGKKTGRELPIVNEIDANLRQLLMSKLAKKADEVLVSGDEHLKIELAGSGLFKCCAG